MAAWRAARRRRQGAGRLPLHWQQSHARRGTAWPHGSQISCRGDEKDCRVRRARQRGDGVLDSREAVRIVDFHVHLACTCCAVHHGCFPTPVVGSSSTLNCREGGLLDTGPTAALSHVRCWECKMHVLVCKHGPGGATVPPLALVWPSLRQKESLDCLERAAQYPQSSADCWEQRVASRSAGRRNAGRRHGRR